MNFTSDFFYKKIKKLFSIYNFLFLIVLYNACIYKLIVIKNAENSFVLLGLFILQLLFIGVYNKYQESSKKFESIIENQLERLHDTKNDIIVLQNLVESKKTRDEELDYKCYKIKNSGIRNIIIQKINQTRFLNIKYDIKIVGSGKFLNFETEKAVCKLLNIFMDNAIESCQSSEKKLIGIEILESDKKVEIVIANYLSEQINLELIFKKRFSTKGGKRGFGLAEARKIINVHKKITNQTKIIDNVFFQIIGIEF